MLCWTSGFFVDFIIYLYLFINYLELYYIMFIKEQIEYNHKVPYRNNRQCLG